MKVTDIKTVLGVIVSSFLLGACVKSPETGVLNTGDFGETATPLKEATDIPIGVAISYSAMLNDPKYAEIVKRDFDGVTFEYHMKHGAIVKDNGELDFSRADALLNASSGLQVFGHTLGWHQNQNATYLKNHAGIVLPAATELLANPGFEEGGASSFTNWSVYNTGNPSGSATVSVGTGAGEVRTGSRSMKVVNPTAYPGSQWRVQVASDLVNTTPGKEYAVTYWVKAAAAGGSIRLSTQTSGGGSAQYQGDQNIGTAWQQVSWNITANAPQTRIVFDLGQAANTYYIDDVSVKEVVPVPSGEQVISKLDGALNNFITGMVNRYKNKVKAWDVVNELFAENGSIRNNSNTATTAADVFVWSNYMGKEYAIKAFQYAAAADPTADLYLNEYNLEISSAKLDSLIRFVQEARTRGVKIDGIGTQMHVSWNTPFAGIDAMFRKLAATGLKIRISELDVKTVNGSAAGAPTPQLLGYQANMVKYIVSSYLKHIPKAQQAGITVWGVTDNTSWLHNNGKEFPLLYDNNYNKKPAYGAFLQGLKGN